MAEDDTNYMRLLVESLEILATDPQGQIAYIDRVGLELDDLAEDHVAPARNAYWMCEEGLISPEVRERAERIDAVFTAISGRHNAHRWTDQAVSDDPAWIEIRTLAREGLRLLKPTPRRSRGLGKVYLCGCPHRSTSSARNAENHELQPPASDSSARGPAATSSTPDNGANIA